jgi:tetratricopeptide (TPR) repeat protein
MTPTDDEIVQELDRLSKESVLAPQERALLHIIVRSTLSKDTSRLYQKALADDLGIESAKQIGVLATRIRTKLAEHYGQLSRPPSVKILLSDWGYEARFTYQHAQRRLDDSVMLLVAHARAALDQRTLPGIATALRYVKQALAQEPAHPLLLSVKAQCHATRALYGIFAAADLRKAEAIVDAIPVGNDPPWEYWFARASVRMALHWDWAGAETAFGRAIALSNGDARFNAWHTALLAAQGRTTEAVDHLRLAVSRSPDSPIVRADLAINQIFAHQLDEAEETIDTALGLFGDRAHYLLYVHRAILYEARGDGARAVAAIQRVPLKWPQTAITLGLRALFAGLNGQQQTARWHLSKLKGARLLAGRKVPAMQLAVACLGAGYPDRAVEWLREASIVERDPNAVLNNVYPFFRHLHRHAGFRALVVNAMKLPLSY